MEKLQWSGDGVIDVLERGSEGDLLVVPPALDVGVAPAEFADQGGEVSVVRAASDLVPQRPDGGRREVGPVRDPLASSGVEEQPPDEGRPGSAGQPGTSRRTPDEIAAAVAWVLSDDAAYLHGAELVVDGGITSTR